MKHTKIALLSLSAVALVSCMNARDHRLAVSDEKVSTFTLGQVQSCIHPGMHQDEVISAIGSPNIVTTGKDGTETWIYDRVSSQAAHSSSNVGGTLILFGGGKRSGAYESSQKTLTVMVKFSPMKKVEAVDYHQSKF